MWLTLSLLRSESPRLLGENCCITLQLNLGKIRKRLYCRNIWEPKYINRVYLPKLVHLAYLTAFFLAMANSVGANGRTALEAINATPTRKNVILNTKFYDLLGAGFVPSFENTFEWAKIVRETESEIENIYRQYCSRKKCNVVSTNSAQVSDEIIADCHEIIVLFSPNENNLAVLSRFVESYLASHPLDHGCASNGALIVGYGRAANIKYFLESRNE